MVDSTNEWWWYNLSRQTQILAPKKKRWDGAKKRLTLTPEKDGRVIPREAKRKETR